MEMNVMDDPIIVSAIQGNVVFAGTANQTIICFNMDTGRFRRWGVSSEPCCMIFSDNELICGFSDGHVARYRQDGTEVWKAKIFTKKHHWSKKLISNIVEYLGVLYISSLENPIATINTLNGGPMYHRWNELEGELYMFPLHRGYVSIYKDALHVPCKKWLSLLSSGRQKIKLDGQVLYCSLSHNKKMLVAHTYSSITLFSAESWKMLWSKPSHSVFAPVFSPDDTKVLIEHFGIMAIVDALTGTIIARIHQDNSVKKVMWNFPHQLITIEFHRISLKDIPLS